MQMFPHPEEFMEVNVNTDNTIEVNDLPARIFIERKTV